MGEKKEKDTLAGPEAHFFGQQQLVTTAREVENNLAPKSDQNFSHSHMPDPNLLFFFNFLAENGQHFTNIKMSSSYVGDSDT